MTYMNSDEDLVFIVHKIKHCPEDVGAARDGQIQEMFGDKSAPSVKIS